MRITKLCEVCKSPFEVKPSHAHKEFCCSKACSIVRRRQQSQRRVEEQHKQPLYAVLYRLYHIDQLSVDQVCANLKISNHTLFKWFDELGIQTRDRSTAVALQWDGNDKRRQEQGDRSRNGFLTGKMDRMFLAEKARTPEIRKRNSESKQGSNNPMFNRGGEKHPRWQGGKEFYYGPNWDKQRIATLERDNYTCQRCGKHQNQLDQQLHVHHKVKFRKFGVKRYEEANALSNLQTLCPQCHPVIEKQLLEPAPKVDHRARITTAASMKRRQP